MSEEKKKFKYQLKANQRGYYEKGLTGKGKIDVVDAVIIDYIYGLSIQPKMDRIIEEDGLIYVHAKWSKIISDNPLLPIYARSAVNRRLEKMIDFKLLKRHFSNQKSKKSYYALTSLAISIAEPFGELSVHENVQSKSSVHENGQGVSTKMDVSVSTKMDTYKSISDKSINNKNITTTGNVNISSNEELFQYVKPLILKVLDKNFKVNNLAKELENVEGTIPEIKEQFARAWVYDMARDAPSSTKGYDFNKWAKGVKVTFEKHIDFLKGGVRIKSKPKAEEKYDIDDIIDHYEKTSYDNLTDEEKEWCSRSIQKKIKDGVSADKIKEIISKTVPNMGSPNLQVIIQAA